MRSKTQGLLAHLFMFLPLLAIPFVASFGVPWLSAKAKDEGVPVSEFPDPATFGPGVGQSNSARHSPDDLFAPHVREAAVDLNLAAGQSRAADQNPHLRNASLTVTQNGPWTDPFENANPSPERPTADAAGREEALAGWAVQTEAAEFGPPEAPRPGEFPDANVEEEPPASQNPFAMMEKSSSPPAEENFAPVSIEDNAFEDPRPSGTAPAPKAFDASRTLFAEAKTQPPAERSVERDPPAPPAITSEVPPAKSVKESPEGLTWESARIRLNQLGIKDYYLHPDKEEQVFLFRCAYTPPDNPRINRLFEAEASEPLEAVRKVLAQVETWTNRQSAMAH